MTERTKDVFEEMTRPFEEQYTSFWEERYLYITNCTDKSGFPEAADHHLRQSQLVLTDRELLLQEGFDINDFGELYNFDF